ncbi:hypothetical protein CC1G_04502 [Coprinopsis cinerea okayama7|uniref:F-box domain-containing protein n=1 Tax=Coprinopsis cinerea (strain Okayama-7 / 130 / ATCC MYA-4618 / FGSC 9003) TaxID=240176 RepID=A8N5C4_COPC7|nr:hypothetical protein CC1G_04502 [Coprinopsis cinerea okayama7\|eukprot:XP_001830069.1 hypothetical protein CC1G_04502 [Coprinopsis cinerea okayama7\
MPMECDLNQIIQELSSTNQPPEEWQRIALEGHRQKISDEIQKVEGMIACPRERIDSLNEEKWAVSGILSPLRRLPSELVAEVVKASLSPLVHDHDQRRHFMTLRCISRLWRQVSYDTPSLWASLTLSEDDFLRKEQGALPSSSLPSRVRTWFDRAADVPTSLYIFADYRYQPDFDWGAYESTVLLAAEDRNWATVRLSKENGMSEVLAAKLVLRAHTSSYRPWRNLKELKIPFDVIGHGTASRGKMFWPVPDIPLDIFLPSLSILSLEIISSVIHANAIISHKGITCLEVIVHHVIPSLLEDFIPNLKFLPSLKKIQYSLAGPLSVSLAMSLGLYYIYPERSGRVVHEGVESLTVSTDGLMVLHYLNLPALRILELPGARYINDRAIEYTDLVYLEEFLEQSRCTIQHLSLHRLYFSPKELRRLFSKMDVSNLEFISIWTKDILGVMRSERLGWIGAARHPLYCKSLRDHHLYGQQPDFDLDDFIECLETRWAGLQPPTTESTSGATLPTLNIKIFHLDQLNLRPPWCREANATQLQRISKLGVRLYIDELPWN